LPTLLLRAYGRTVSLEGPAGALAQAREHLPANYRVGTGPPDRCWAVCEHSGSGWAATVEGQTLSFWVGVAEAMAAVLSDMELWIAEFARRMVFVHAGCVAVDGHAIVLPGRSMSGKSCLTAALVRAGASYYSDEYAVLDQHGLVRPYARKPAIRPEEGAPVARLTLEELGAVGRGPAPVHLIAALRFDPGAGWRPEILTRGPALLRLLDNAIAARTRPRAVLSALEGVTLDARAIEGTRGDAEDTAALLLSMVS
jgi:hypothetical protein